MNTPTTISSSFATNRLMVPLSICLAVGVGIFGTVEASNAHTVSNIVEDNFAFGRPISVGSGTRRKRLPGSQLKGGSGILTIEELENEFEAVSFGDLFFDRALQESSMSYSMSYSFGDYFSMSFSYETDQAARTKNGSPTSPEATDEANTPIVNDAPEPLVPSPGDDTTAVAAPPEALNAFACDSNGDIALDLNTSSASDATSVDIVYSYSFETTGDDPNTVSLIEAAIVGTMVSTLLDCLAPSDASDGAGRALTSASSVSTTFSQVLSQDPCSSSMDGPSCYNVESAINFRLQDGPSAEEAMVQALRAVKSAIDNGDYVVPSVTSITYIGPEVDDSDSTQAPITANPNAVDEAPPSVQPGDSGLSSMTKVGIGLMSVGGVVLIAALVRRRTLRARRHTEHVRLKDDGSRDGESSLLTIENSQDSPASTPTRNGVSDGDFQPQLEHDIA
mmetsp:Transcript_4021/g.11457  ORF Transcript_4021/g.11457 Transcript_4021/m.11457 type:complete len:449 (+) Transcript_4021:793-2139(+)